MTEVLRAHSHFGVETTVRPLLAFYNTFEEIDRLIAVVRRTG